jgi:predicted acetyltransferase
LVRSLDEPTKVINSFFIVAPARGGGVGTEFVRAIVTTTPGRWSVAYQDANAAAAAFWPRVAARIDPGRQLDHRPVPGRPELPPDAWVTFDVPG